MLPANNKGLGMDAGFPDVCLSPALGPFPFPNFSLNAMKVPFSPNVWFSMLPALNMASFSPITLGDQLGALLFQLPPTLKKDLARLDAFLDTLPPRAPAAFEFRHPSWFDAEVFARLKERGRALCVADSETLETPLEVTADFGYFRLRDEGYQPADIEAWARKIAPLRSRCNDIYVYFKHEEQGIGPAFARQLMTHLGLRVDSH